MSPANWQNARYLAIAVAASGLLLALLTGVAVSPLPLRGAGVFGAIVSKIKGNPGATTAIALMGGAALWLVLAMLVAGQELLARRRQSR